MGYLGLATHQNRFPQAKYTLELGPVVIESQNILAVALRYIMAPRTKDTQSECRSGVHLAVAAIVP
jgi:hypothetical protein